LARRPKGRRVNGVLVLNKPQGLTSNRALQRAKAIFYAAKGGHTGSLDPLATGVLPICFGEATKLSQYLLDADKAYTTTVTLGVNTTTADAEGEVLAESDCSTLTEQDVLRVLPAFRGDILQVPPMFSALKKDGKPLYEIARAGKSVEREARSVTIYSLELTAFRPGEKAEIDLDVRCSKGTYIRTIAEDIGKALGVGGHVSRLHRSASGPYLESESVTMERIQALRDEDAFEALDDLLMPVDSAVAHLPAVKVDSASCFYLSQGQPVMVPKLTSNGVVRIVRDDGDFCGIGEVLEDGRFAPRRMLVVQ